MVRHLSQIQHLSPTRVAEQSAAPMVTSVDIHVMMMFQPLSPTWECSTGGQEHVVYVTREQQEVWFWLVGDESRAPHWRTECSRPNRKL